MAKIFKPSDLKGSLTLIVRPLDDPEKPVDAEKFLDAATRWLSALSVFASDQGQQVRWEVAGLQRSSAIVQVLPVDVATGLVASELAKKWQTSIRAIENTGKAPEDFKASSVRALGDFAGSASDLSIAVAAGTDAEPHPISARTQKGIQNAIATLPPDEYQIRGTVRGRLAVLNSWNPKERWFRLQLPLSPDKHVKCVYTDERLVDQLGDSFEDLLDVTGLLHYRLDDPWPFHVAVENVRRLPEKPPLNIDQLIGAITLPEGVDSVSFVRSLRDAE